MELYLKNMTTGELKHAPIESGAALIKNLDSVVHKASVRKDRYNDEALYKNEDIVYISPNGTSMDDREQDVIPTGETMDLNWKTYQNFASPKFEDNFTEDVNQNQLNKVKINYDTLVQHDITCSITPMGRTAIMLPGDKIFYISKNTAQWCIYDVMSETYTVYGPNDYSFAGHLRLPGSRLQEVESIILLPNGKVFGVSSIRMWNVVTEQFGDPTLSFIIIDPYGGTVEFYPVVIPNFNYLVWGHYLGVDILLLNADTAFIKFYAVASISIGNPDLYDHYNLLYKLNLNDFTLQEIVKLRTRNYQSFNMKLLKNGTIFINNPRMLYPE